MRVRFAPSPTGQLHVGNARTALFNWLLARGAGGTFILRIEDTDVERSTRESEAAILRDLRWLGLDWDEGPDVGGAHGPYRQSERLHLYQSYAKELLSAERGLLLLLLDGAARRRAPGGARRRTAGALRRHLPPAVARAGRGAHRRRRAPRDPLPRSRGPRRRLRRRGARRRPLPHRRHRRSGDRARRRHPAYNFAVVVDDALMEVTHVVRGEDHISNTPRQMLLYEALGFTPPAFAHLALVMGPDHSPLSKRHGATSVAEFRAKGYLPEALVNYLALIGWSPGGGDELLPIDELARRFSLEDVGHSAGVFDEEKLAWVNRHYLKIADPARLAELSLPYLQGGGRRDDARRARPRRFWRRRWRWRSASVDRLNQVPARLALLFDYDAATALADRDAAGRDERAGRARGGRARWPRSSRRRRGSTARGSARSRTA